VEVDSSLSKLARPPRSLVSVESAENRLTKTRKAKPSVLVGNGAAAHGHVTNPQTPPSPLASGEARMSMRETPRSAGDVRRRHFLVSPP
jgi:hypothetical protein